MNSTLTFFSLMIALAQVGFAQVSLPVGTTLLDFTGFTGTGFSPAPATGQLNSTTWIVTGMSDGAISPGGLAITGDFARGSTTGGVGTGGLYSYDDGGASPGAVWIQPTGGDMSPGTIQLLVENTTGAVMTSLTVEYDLIVLNDQNSSNSVNLSYSTTGFGGTFTAVPAAGFISEAVSDGLTTITARSVNITGISIPNGGQLALSWEIDQVVASGAQDEIGLDNIDLTPSNTVTADRLSFQSTPATATRLIPFTIDVCATDGGSNTDSGYTTNINLSDAGTSTSFFSITPLSGSLSPASGCATFTITPSTAGVINLEATSGTLVGGAGSPYSFSITVLSGLNLFISEYIEGSSTNKCIEVYNGTGSTIDLGAGGYAISQFSNGSNALSAGSPIALTGTVAAGDVYVICSDETGPDLLNQADQTSAALTYAGDDGIAFGSLSLGVLDFIGATTGDPGNAWAGGGCSTADQTLVRKASVTTGDPNNSDTFDPSAEWDCYPQNAWAYLGNHGTPITATTLAFYTAPPTGCLEADGYFRVEVCAQDANGFPQPDFTNAITLSLATGIGPLIVAGENSKIPEFGCATFFVKNSIAENITLTASATGVSSVSSSSLTIASSCSEITPLTGVFDPCGSEDQNEYLVAQNGNASLDIADLAIGQIDQTAGIQPNYNFTWNLTGSTTFDNPNPTCNLLGNVCNRLLNVNNAADLTILNTLRTALNTQAGCPLFELPTATGTGGAIPAGAYFITFFGAGGDGTAGSEGFDGLGTNLDFSAFCASSVATVYLVAGERNSAATGFFNNSATRTYRVINGTAERDLEYAIPTGSNSTQTISADGSVISPGSTDCVAEYQFLDSPFPVELLSFDAAPVENQHILLTWETASELNNDRFVIERKKEGETFQEIGTHEGAGTTTEAQAYTFTDESPAIGRNFYRLMQWDLDGTAHPSPVVEASISTPGDFRLLGAYPNPAQDYFSMKLNLPQSGILRIDFYETSGKVVHSERHLTEAGIQLVQPEISGLSEGLYLYRIHLNGSTLNNKLIIN